MCKNRVNIAGLKLLSLERPTGKTGPCLVPEISEGFPSVLDKNGSLYLNYLEQTMCFMLNTRFPYGNLKFWYKLDTCRYIPGIWYMF